MKKIIVFSFIALFVAIGGSLSAQNLLDNADYRKGLEYQNMAKQAYAVGDYDKSMEYSDLAQEHFRKAREYAEMMRLRFTAYNLKNRATDRIKYADYINAAVNHPVEYGAAKIAFAEADSAFNRENYQASIDASRKVLDLLRDIRPVVAQQPDKSAAPEPVKPAEPALPEFYTVRLIPEKRDCFWRIAEYEFVYNDPWKWRVLYEANKDLIPDPNNPHLIEPGIRLRIPSVAGEKRGGDWQPPK